MRHDPKLHVVEEASDVLDVLIVTLIIIWRMQATAVAAAGAGGA